MKVFATAAVVLLALTSAAAAQGYRSTDRVDLRQDKQQQRIEQGVRSGEITRHEYQRLQAEQARIRDLERDAKRDGRIDRREAARIEDAQDRASRHIREEKHDREARGSSSRHSDRSGGWNRRWW